MKLLANILFYSLLVWPSYTFSEENHNHDHQPTTGIESLSPELRELLKQEMLALQDGMKSIIPAYASGSWAEIQHIAHKMKNSYILKQNLTDAQIKELHGSLSESFIKQDQYFHYLAGMLNHAAKNKKAELIGFYFSELAESCVSCHRQFAVHKFPAFAPEEVTNEHHEH